MQLVGVNDKQDWVMDTFRFIHIPSYTAITELQYK